MTSQMMPPQGQPPIEEPTQFTAPGDNFEGPENGPPDFSEPQQNPEELESQIISLLDDVPDDKKELLAMYLTPEFADFMGLFLGEAYGNAFHKLADPTKILVPIDRDQVLGQQNPTQEPSVTNEGATPSITGMDTPPATS